MSLQLGPVDLNGIVRSAVDLARGTAETHPVRLDLDETLPKLRADSDKLTQILTNLLSNAVKYSPTGGEIHISTRGENGLAHLSVRDEGIGIPAEALETVFERYARVESGAASRIQGTGLGLPIVRQIAQLHAGGAWAESTLGQGSTIHVQLPLDGPPAIA
jgi:two-component system sensor histidine kinase VicK